MQKFFLFFIALAPLAAMAQDWQITGFGGISNYQGDFQEKRITTNQSHGSFGLGVQYNLTPHVVIRSGLVYGKISGDDKLSKDSMLVMRNLNFTSQILEFNLMAEYDFLDLENKKFTPYVFAGIAVFGFDPYTYDTLGNKYYLQPLSTEGEGLAAYPDNKPYHRVQVSIPFGAGIKLKVNEQVTIGYEVGLRKTFTDYLDDLSNRYVDRATLLAARGPKAVELAYRSGELKDGNPQYPADGTIRGGPTAKDYYYFQGLTVSYRLKGRSSGNGFRKNGMGNQMDCPKNVY
ncbi:type IX secretion system protein PorG [Flavihumibacter profundi]|uniref:type IX secretion system protein PorG n=1 Tax=Flavihumibacter profundi TaxID=2716883 RepID=UPI001CC3A880|nr:DUF6089 family protein [Flavihumibacter profundi]MBZ5856146.1 PorT family protein [Flavihumibacter profundi]